MTLRPSRSAGPAPVLPSMRRLLLLAAVLVLLAGATLFLFPLRTGEYFAWTIASPMTAVFLGAAYWSAVLLEVGGARATGWAQGRIAVPTVFVFTTLTLVATLMHLALFHTGSEHGFLTRVVAWAWLGVYVAVPVLMVVITVVQQRSSLADPPRGRAVPPAVRLALVVLLAVFAVVGVGLFVVPGAAASWWPWDLTPLTARAVGAWVIGLAVAAGHALVENDLARLGPLGPTAVAFALLEAVALARYGSELDWSVPSAWMYVAGLASMLAVGSWIVLARPGPAAS